MHDVGIPHDIVQPFDLHCPESADSAQIVATQIHEHIVFREFLFVGEQFGFKRLVFRVGASSGTGSRQRKGVEFAVFQFDLRFGGSACHFHVGAGEVEHIGRRVDGAQDAVGVEQTALKGRGQPVGQHNLEDVALPDILLGAFHHPAETFPVEERGDVAGQFSGRFGFAVAVPQEVCHLTQLQHCLVVAGFPVREPHIDDQNDFLPHMVEGDHLVEQHEVQILEAFGILGLTARGGFTVEEVVVGEVSHQSAGKGGQIVETRTFVIRENLPQHVGGTVGGKAQMIDLHLSVHAGDLHLRVVAQKGVASPFFTLLRRFQQIAVRRDVFENAHGFDGGEKVGEYFAAHRYDAVVSVFGFFENGCKFRSDFHIIASYGFSGHKKIPDRRMIHCFCQGRILQSKAGKYPRCHLDSRHKPHALRDTDISPATDVCPHVAAYSMPSIRNSIFPCALRGPFDGVFPA